MGVVRVAATQMACGADVGANLDRAEGLVRRAAGQGARIILLQELFAGEYFCKDEDRRYMGLAAPFEGNPVVERMAGLAGELSVVLPVSFFERDGGEYYNSVAVVDADGSVMGLYRKSHIPSGPGYEEKFYFRPGDTGFKVWDTAWGRVGVGICWDQWFPEAARCMALMGADILMYPTAIGSEPAAPWLDTRGHWRRVMQGHAGANIIPVVASNRVGTEQGSSCAITFYGTSFIASPTGKIVERADEASEGVVCADFDFERIREMREDWGLFRDRRPELYSILTRRGDTG